MILREGRRRAAGHPPRRRRARALRALRDRLRPVPAGLLPRPPPHPLTAKQSPPLGQRQDIDAGVLGKILKHPPLPGHLYYTICIFSLS